jgi:hypothetical protein
VSFILLHYSPLISSFSSSFISSFFSSFFLFKFYFTRLHLIFPNNMHFYPSATWRSQPLSSSSSPSPLALPPFFLLSTDTTCTRPSAPKGDRESEGEQNSECGPLSFSFLSFLYIFYIILTSYFPRHRDNMHSHP